MHVTAHFSAEPPPLVADFSRGAWTGVAPAIIDRTWHGDPAPTVLGTIARVLWTPSHLWFGFECRYSEIDADTEFDPLVERHCLWDRDVCEAFVQAPEEPHGDSYKEFEVAPTAQWCDLAIHRTRVEVDINWQSGIETAAAVDDAAAVWRAVMRIPFAAFGATPRTGDAWRVNLFRISRVHGERHYLAFAPTGTDTPNFHVPACFVPLRFAGQEEGTPRETASLS